VVEVVVLRQVTLRVAEVELVDTEVFQVYQLVEMLHILFQ
tara:strand:+ start:122 stop:241 length:120 start_codon:yes stop_codon:yes gene_type:complete